MQLKIVAMTTVALLLSTLTRPASAGESTLTTAPSATADSPKWAYSATASYYAFRHEDDLFVAVATAGKGPLHLEGRYNYEARGSESLFAGWKFSGGKKLAWEVTPILGAVFGSMRGVSPGVEASFGYGIADIYTEMEYVRDTQVKEDSFYYSWNELGFTPLEWLRFGLVSQKTRVYQNDRDIQRGLFAQLIYRKATLGVYVFNPDDSDDRYAVFSLGAEF